MNIRTLPPLSLVTFPAPSPLLAALITAIFLSHTVLLYGAQAPRNQRAMRLQPRPFNVTSSARRFAWVFIAAVLQQTERAIYQRSPRTDVRQLGRTRMQREDTRANRGGLWTRSRAEAVALEVSSMQFAQAKLHCRAQSSQFFWFFFKALGASHRFVLPRRRRHCAAR